MTSEATTISPLLRLEVEDFLSQEAALLDEWRLDEWLSLFTEDARYVVPTTDLPQGDPHRHLVFIDDDMTRLRGRVVRLKSRHAHREYPWSRTRRLITNVRVTGVEGEEIQATASFVVFRVRDAYGLGSQADAYMGRYLYTLRRVDGALKIAFRRAELDLEALHTHGAVSIIL
ncbi:MAG TPA: aromatic-ring-hydroxylating dioxygenase subunit beta [Dehalococcoidia bacterium]|nr:aromatic-ring-hydroxylating dioxygenase subunit beta [Dehalococcoidia bacterium]